MKLNKKIFLFFILAFLIRLIALNQSLWLDEGTTAKIVMHYDYLGIVTKFLPQDFHPPLYYMFMKLWSGVFGNSEVALRMPSIIFSLITGYFVYRIAKLLNGYIAGVWAAAFFLFNPLIVYYSQEARMYSMATMFLTIALFFFVGGRSGRDPTSAQRLKVSTSGRETSDRIYKKILLGLFLSLSLLTFYGSIFFIVVILIYLLYKKQFKLFFVSGVMLGITCLILSPLLYAQLANARQTLKIVSNWSLVLGKANIKNLILIPIKFTSGRISFEPKKIYYLVAGGWLLIVGCFYVRGSLKNKLLLFLVKFPLFLGFLISFFAPMLQYFRFLYLIVPMSILLSFGGNKNWQRYLLLSGFLIFTFAYLLNPAFHREDWKNLSKSIPAKSVVYAIPSSMDAFKYYSKAKIVDLRLLRNLNTNLTVISYTSEIYGLDYKKRLSEKKYILKNTKTFNGLSVEYWRSF